MANFFKSVAKGFKDPKSLLTTVATGGTNILYDAAGGAQGLGFGAGKGGVASDYKRTVSEDKVARAKAASDPNAGFSPFIDETNGYVERYGNSPIQKQGQLADTTQNAYQPLQNQIQGMMNQPGVTANVDPAFRQYQMGLAQQLQQQAMGQGPSVAQMQLQQATDQSLNNSMAAIRASSGPNGALGARSAALAGAQQLGQMGGNSAILRLQEQQQAQQQLAGLAQQGRTGDIQTTQLGADVALKGRQQQLDTAGLQQQVIGNRISGTQDALRGALGIDVAGAQAKREADATETARRRAMQDKAVGAGITGLATGIGSAFS